MAAPKEEYQTQVFEDVDSYTLWLTQQATDGWVLRCLVSHWGSILVQATNYSPDLQQVGVKGSAVFVVTLARSVGGF